MNNHTKQLVILAMMLGLSIVTAPGLAHSSPPVQSSAAAASTPGVSAEQGAMLVEKHCLSCHIVEKLKRYRKTQAQWDLSIKTMIADDGVQLSATERSALAEYMANHYGAKKRN